MHAPRIVTTALGVAVLVLSIAAPDAGAPRGTDPTSGGASLEAKVQSPADVVRSALRAQVAGDIDALMEHFALDRMDEAAIADGRLAFGTFGERVGLSKLKVKPLATGYGDLGDLAVVRAEVSVRMAADGEIHRQTHGIIATLVGGEGAWRILALDPDDLLNAEIVAREAPRAMAMVATGRAVAAATPKRAVTLHQINTLLNKAMTTRRMSEAEMLKLTTDGQAAFIGRFPGVGDAIAQVYQVANVGYNLYQGGRELVSRGFTPILLMQVAQTAVGAVQIATELVPGADTAADAVGMYVENVTNHMEMQRAIREFQAEATRPRDGYDARFHAVPGYGYPDGLRMSLDPEVETAYGRPVQGVALTTLEDLGRAIPFQIVADLPLPSELEPFAEELGAVQVGDGSEWRVPVDLSLLTTSTESTEHAAGDRVLQDPRVIRSADGATTAIAWTSTCVRGSQQLALVLPSGEPVLGPEVVNKVMNEIADLRIPEVDPGGAIQVPLSEPKTIRVLGRPSVPGRPDIDLTRYRECLFTSLVDTEVITIERDEGDQLRIVGVAPGTASLRLRLGGSTGRLSDRVPDIAKEVPVTVTDDVGGRWQGEHAGPFYNDDWTVDYQATVTTTGSLDGCIEERAGSWLVLTCPVPPATTDSPEVDRYTITVTVRDVAPVEGWDSLLAAMGEGWSSRVLLGFSEADLAETGTIRTHLEVPRKPGQSDVEAVVVVWLDYLPDDSLSRWTAGDRCSSCASSVNDPTTRCSEIHAKARPVTPLSRMVATLPRSMSTLMPARPLADRPAAPGPILVVDDDRKIAALVRAYLEREGFAVIAAHDGQEALRRIREEAPALVVLDVMLPETDGLAVARAVRAADDPVPILMLSARGSVPDRIRGLEWGADDYLPKPFSPAELVARVKVLLRRAAPPPAAPPLVHGDLVVDVARHEVRQGGRLVPLTSVELRLLVALLSADGRVLSRDQLLDAVYGTAGDGEVLDRTVDVHIGRLRDKLGDRAEAPRYVATVRGAGYRAAPPPAGPTTRP